MIIVNFAKEEFSQTIPNDKYAVSCESTALGLNLARLSCWVFFWIMTGIGFLIGCLTCFICSVLRSGQSILN